MSGNDAQRREAGVSIVELLVVMLIVTIISAIIFSQMAGGRDAGEKSQGRQVARAYYEVANDFAADNGGSVPVASSANWPSASFQRGPINHLNVLTGQRYLRTIPEAIGNGRVRLVGGSGSTPSAGPTSAPVLVRYTVTTPQTFLIVASRKGTPYCKLANGPGGPALPDC